MAGFCRHFKSPDSFHWITSLLVHNLPLYLSFISSSCEAIIINLLLPRRLNAHLTPLVTAIVGYVNIAHCKHHHEWVCFRYIELNRLHCVKPGYRVWRSPKPVNPGFEKTARVCQPYLRILIISYLATFLGTNSHSVLMCRKEVNQSISQSLTIWPFITKFGGNVTNSIWIWWFEWVA